MKLDPVVISYIVIGAVVFGLSAGVVIVDILAASQSSALGTGDVYLIHHNRGYYIISQRLGINGFLNTNMSLPMEDGVCYQVQYNIETKPLTISFALTQVDLSNCITP